MSGTRVRMWRAAWAALAAIGLCLGVGLTAVSATAEDDLRETQKSAKIGDYVVVEGVVFEQQGDRLYTIRDAKGDELLVYLPEFLTREKGLPGDLERIRVGGKWDNKKLDKGMQGVRAATLERLGVVTGAHGDPSKADASPVHVTMPPAAPQAPITEDDVIRPTATPEWVDRLGSAGDSYQAAKSELEEAETAYARALYRIGESGNVDPAIIARQQQAQSEVDRQLATLGELVREARAAGISEKPLELFERRHDLR